MKRILYILPFFLISLSFGQTYLGETDILTTTGEGIYRRAYPYLAPATGTLDSVCVHYNCIGLSSRTFYMGIYDDAVGVPGVRLGYTSALSTTAANRWHCAKLIDDTPEISENDTIWLSCVFSSASFVAVETTNGALNVNRRQPNTNDTYLAGMPTPFGLSSSTQGQVSMYAHFVEADLPGYAHYIGGDKYLNKIDDADVWHFVPAHWSPPPPLPGTTGDTIYFYENFETIPSLAEDTVAKYWKTQRAGSYFPADQSIANYGGEYYGKVWRSIFQGGAGPGESGFDFETYFSHALNDELWVSNDLWCDPLWTGTSTHGFASGKILNGLHGGSIVGYVLDSSATGSGWRTHGVWGSGNPNALRPYWYGPQVSGFQQFVAPGLVAPRNYWINVTKYVKLNTPGHHDGIFALFINDTLNCYIDTMMFRSAAQFNNEERNSIDGLILKYAFGGGGEDYISSRDNEILIDHVMSWNYSDTSQYNWPESPQIGMRIVKPTYPESAVYQTDSVFYNRTFTNDSDTIWSHESGSVYVADGDRGDANLKNRVYTTTIIDNDIHLVFMKYHNGYNESSYRESYIKIYTVVDGDRTLYRWFQETSDGETNGEPVIGTVYSTEAQEVQIDYYPGSDFNEGWKLRYY